jgi:hypothetical protein
MDARFSMLDIKALMEIMIKFFVLKFDFFEFLVLLIFIIALLLSVVMQSIYDIRYLYRRM